MKVSEPEAAWHPELMPTLAIGRLARLLTKLNDVRLRSAGVTASQLPVLVALKSGERRTQMELARILDIEQPSMAQLLARMERDGLVRRTPSPNDRRSSLVSLTDEALARMEPGRKVLREGDRMACAGLDAHERDLLISLIDRMASTVEAALQPQPRD